MTVSYEERSLGVFEAPPEDEDEEPDDINRLKTRRERVGRYVGWHIRRQMSIGTSSAMALRMLITVLSNTPCVQTFGGLSGQCFSSPLLREIISSMRAKSGSTFSEFSLNWLALLEALASVLDSRRYVNLQFMIICFFTRLQDNFSFVGAMSPLSKLVVIVIMWVKHKTTLNAQSWPNQFF